MKQFNSWLWPDHVIGKRESRELACEHNALVNEYAKLLEASKRVQTVVIQLDGGLVQDVVSAQPLNFITVDCDVEGCTEDEVCPMPPILGKALREEGNIYRPRHLNNCTVSDEAVTEVLELQKKVSAEE
jgi:hypothetical protein